MARLVAVTPALALGGCGSVQTNPKSTSLRRSGGVMEVAVGGRMVDNTSTTVTVAALTQGNRVEGVRAEVEAERPGYWAEVDLVLARGRTIEFKGWRIEVLEAMESSIRYEVVGSPAP